VERESPQWLPDLRRTRTAPQAQQQQVAGQQGTAQGGVQAVMVASHGRDDPPLIRLCELTGSCGWR
jgi:hypothetical protein